MSLKDYVKRDENGEIIHFWTAYPFNGQILLQQIKELGEVRRRLNLSNPDEAFSYLMARADDEVDTAMLIAHLREFGGTWRY